MNLKLQWVLKKTKENNYLQSKADFLIIDEGGSGGGGS